MSHNLVLIRHGQSTWNLENRFTGWTDVGLTEEGQREAIAAGALLQREGFVFDVAYSSVLRRAIHTLHHVLSELGQDYLPVVKAWQLNERHYGALQGLNKSEMAAKFGDEQVKIWRRSYATPPPALALDDPRHPRFDRRYDALATQERPATEALKDTVARMVPYWEQTLAPAIRSGQRLLVVAHGNSLRALIKHLEGISDEAIVELNIPTGRPLLVELSDDLRPLRSRYLGDAEAAERAAQSVAAQGRPSDKPAV